MSQSAQPIAIQRYLASLTARERLELSLALEPEPRQARPRPGMRGWSKWWRRAAKKGGGR